MVRRFIEELAALGVETPPPIPHVDMLDTTFASLLVKFAAGRRVILLVDGVDQFEPTPRGRFLTWLPRPWPAAVKLITTAGPGDAAKTLAERDGIEMAALPPLDAGEARHIAKAICARYHRAIEPDVLYALVEKASPAGLACGHPLWLSLAVEELNLLDADDFQRVGRNYSGMPAERLRSLMLDIVSELPPEATALYGVIFDRAAALFGPPLAQAFLGLMALSRGGWRETDLRALLPRLTAERWDGLRFASLRRVFRGQLRQHGEFGQWDVNHAQMRVAARAHVTSAWGGVAAVHAAMADHLCRSPMTTVARQRARGISSPPAIGGARREHGDGSLAEPSIKARRERSSTSRSLPRRPRRPTGTDRRNAPRSCRRQRRRSRARRDRLVHYFTDALRSRAARGADSWARTPEQAIRARWQPRRDVSRPWLICRSRRTSWAACGKRPVAVTMR